MDTVTSRVLFKFVGESVTRKGLHKPVTQMGVPGDKETVKEPIMRTTIISWTSKKGIQPTIYEARASFNIDENKVSIIEMKNKLLSLDKIIGFSHVIPNTMNFNNEVTKFGIQFIGSPLSYQLLPLA